MRIAITSWTNRNAGGVETYLGNIIPALAGAGHEIDVRFILRGRLLPKTEPRPVRMRDVLDRAVAPLLIVRAAVCRTKVEGVEGLVVRLHPERDADEPAGARYHHPV